MKCASISVERIPAQTVIGAKLNEKIPNQFQSQLLGGDGGEINRFLYFFLACFFMAC